MSILPGETSKTTGPAAHGALGRRSSTPTQQTPTRNYARPWQVVLATLLCVAFLFPIVLPTTSAAFVGPTSLMVGTFPNTSEWSQAGVYSFSDLSDTSDAPQSNNNIVKYYQSVETLTGGTAAASALNPITNLYFRFDHTTTVPETTNFNVQMNLGTASPGYVDHILQMRVTAANTVSVRLSEYDLPYPAIGAFTTGSITLKSSNLVGDLTAFQAGVVTQTGKWDATQYAFAVKIPIGFFTNSAHCLVKADGTGSVSMLGAMFTTPGSFGAVATIKDKLSDASGVFQNIITNTVSGATTLASSANTQLAWVTQPASGTAGATLSSMTVEIRNAGGVKDSTATQEVTVAIGTNPGSGTLSGTLTVAAVAGTATFSTLSINNAGTGYTLVATAAGLTSSTSSTFNIVTAATATTIAASGGSSFSGVTAGGTQVLSAIVRDQSTNPFQGTTVNWAVTGGGGSVSAATSVTGADGIASITLTTGTTVGSNTVTATVSGLTGSPVTYTVSTVAGAATQIAAVQSSFSGVTAGGTQVIQAIVKDVNNNVKAGVTVNWAVASGGGSVSAATSVTGADGIASITLTTGATMGSNTATATVSGLTGSPVTFTVTTVAGSASQIAAVQSSFTGVTAGGTQVLQAIVKDANNNVVAGVTVNWAVTSGGGSVSAGSSVSGADGIATITLTTGTTVGTNTVTATSGSLSGSPVTFTVTTVAGAATQIAAVQSSFTGVTAGNTQVIQAIVKDANNNVVAGVTVNWAVTGGGGSVSAATSVTGADGIATITLTTGTTVASNTATATKTGLTGSPVTFTVGTVAGAASQIAAVQSSFTGVTAGSTQVIQAIVKDVNNNVKAGVTVNWAITSGGGSVSASSSVTGADGIASITLTTGTTVGSNVATATSGSLTGSPVTFTVTTVAGAASQIAAVQASFSGVTAGDTQVIQAIVKDVNNNVKAGVTVNWAVTGGGGSVSAATSVTGADGIASITLTTGTSMGSNTATATVSGLTGSPVTFTVSTVAGAATQISAVQASFSGITAGGTQALQAIVRDANGNPVAGVTVNWAITSGGGSVSGATSVTGADGIATITLTTGTSVGSNAATATVSGLTGSPVSFSVASVAGVAAQIAAVQASFTGVTAGATQVIQAIVKDANDNVKSGVTVDWAVTGGGGSVSAASSVTGADGIASITLTTGTTVGSNTATATSGSLSGSPVTYTVATVAGAATQIAAVQASFSGVTAGSTQVIQAIVKDANNNVKAGVTVNWAVTAGGGSVSASSSVTGADGIASITLTTGTTVGSNTATATSGSLSGSPVTFTVGTVAGAATQIAAVQASFTGIGAGGTQVLQAIVKDANNNVKAGVTVNWAVTAGGGSVSASSSVTGADGIASITLTTGGSAGTNTATATSGSLSGSPVTFTVTTSAGVASQIAAVQASFTGVTAGATQVLQAIVRDSSNNPVAGTTVNWAVTSGGGSVSAATSVSGADGIASITLTTGTSMGSNGATATVSGLTGSPVSFSVATVAGAATQISAVQATFSGVTAGGTQVLQAIVRDANGNPVAGITVSWAVTGGGGSVSAATSVTGADGIASITLTSGTTVGSNTATATVSGLTGSPVTFTTSTVAGAATQIAAVQASFTGVTAGGTQVLQAIVKDVNNNVKAGVTVNWAVTSGGGSVSAATSVTGSDGIASITLTTGASVGSNAATATVSGLTGSPVSFSVETVAGSATQISAVQASFSGVTAGSTQVVQALVRDASNNAVAGVTVNWAVASGGGSVSAATSVTGADGIASITLTTGTTVGSNTVTATKTGLTGSPVTFTVTTVAGPATQIAAVQASFTGVTVGSTQVIQAIVKDVNNNVKAGVTVNWAVTSGGGSVSAATSVTGSDGIASITLTTGTTVGSNAATATVTGLTGSPVSFSVPTVAGPATQIAAVQAAFTGISVSGDVTLQAIVKDANNNVKAGVTVNWAVTSGGGSVSGATSVTGADGIASITLTTGGTAGSNGATATVTGLTGSPVAFTVSTTAGAATQIAAVQAAFTNVVAGSTQVVQAIVRDASNNPVAGVTVSWAVTGGAGSVSAASSVSGADGIASITLTTGTATASNTVTASVSGLTGSPVTFTVSTIAGAATQIAAVQASFTGVTVATTQVVQAIVKDVNNNVKAGVTVNWAVASGGGSVSAATSVTGSDGIASITLTAGNVVGSNSVTATVLGLTGSPVTFTVATVAGPATQIAAVQASFTGVTAGSTQVIQAIVKDAHNNVKAGVTVNWAITAGGGSLSAASSVTGADGIASITVTTGTTMGANTATATVSGLTGSPVSFSVATVAGAATQIAAVQSSFTGVTAGTGQVVQVIVKDANNNVVSGVTVNWAIASGGGSLSAASSVTAANGIASITLTTSGTVGTATITATSGSLTGSPVSITVATSASTATNLSAATTTYNSVVAGSNQTLTARVTDTNGNPVAGVAVTWLVLSGGGSVSAVSSVSGADGYASITFTTGTTMGANTVRASSGTLTGSPITYTVNTVAGPAANIAAVQASFSNVPANSPRVLQARVTDANGNVVAGTAVTWTVYSGTGTLSSVGGTTGADGIVSATLTPGATAGAVVVRATSGSLAGSPVSFTVNAVGTPGFTLTLTDGSTVVNESGTTDVVRVVLNGIPESNVVISVVSNRTAEASVSPASLTFTPSNWNVSQTLTVTGEEEFVVDGSQQVTLTFAVVDASSSNEFDALADQTRNVTVLDNDAAGVALMVVDHADSASSSTMANYSTAIFPARNLINLTTIGVRPSASSAVPVKMEALQLESMPSGLPTTPSIVTPGMIWEFSFKTESGTTLTIAESTFRFFVSYAWKNTTCPAATCSIRVFHWTGSAWETIIPTLVSSNDTGQTFDAYTTSFSPFVVGGISAGLTVGGGGGGGWVPPVAPVVPSVVTPVAPDVPIQPVVAPTIEIPEIEGVLAPSLSWTFLLPFGVALSLYSTGVLAAKHHLAPRSARATMRASQSMWQAVRAAKMPMAQAIPKAHGFLTAVRGPLSMPFGMMGRLHAPPAMVGPPTWLAMAPSLRLEQAVPLAQALSNTFAKEAKARKLGHAPGAALHARSLAAAHQLNEMFTVLQARRDARKALAPAVGPAAALAATPAAMALSHTLAAESSERRLGLDASPELQQKALGEAQRLSALFAALHAARKSEVALVPEVGPIVAQTPGPMGEAIVQARGLMQVMAGGHGHDLSGAARHQFVQDALALSRTLVSLHAAPAAPAVAAPTKAAKAPAGPRTGVKGHPLQARGRTPHATGRIQPAHPARKGGIVDRNANKRHHKDA